MEGWLRKGGRLTGAAAAKRRYFVLDAPRARLLLRHRAELLSFVDLALPNAVRRGAARGFKLLSGERVYELQAETSELADAWVKALLPFTVGLRSPPAPEPDQRTGMMSLLSSDKHHGQRMWIGDLMRCCETGDVILFSTKDGGASAIRFFTGSEWNHVGMIIRSADQPLILEWAGGLYLSSLHARLKQYWVNGEAHVFTFRKLCIAGGDVNVVRRDLTAFARKIMSEHRGNGEFPLADIIPGYFGKMVRGHAHHGNSAKDDDLDKLFCSKTVAVCFKNAGLLKRELDANDIFPKHFSSKFDQFMQYQGGASLGREIDISFEPNLLARKASVRFLMTTRPMKRFLAALRIQRIFRAHRARLLLQECRKVGRVKAVRKSVTGSIAASLVSSRDAQIMQQLKEVTSARRLLEHGVLIDKY